MGYSHNLNEKKMLQLQIEDYDKKLKAFDEKIKKAKSVQEATLLYQERNLTRIKRNALEDRIKNNKGCDVMVHNIKIIV